MHRDLERICLRCLQKDPKDRYGSAADLAGDLRSFRENRPVNGVGWWRIVQALLEPHYQTSQSFATRYHGARPRPHRPRLHTAVWGRLGSGPTRGARGRRRTGLAGRRSFLATLYMFGRRYWESDSIERMTG